MVADLRGVNAMGVGDQNIDDERGGNNSRGVFDQVRPTGIMATGGRDAKNNKRIDRPRDGMDRSR
jgi:hypothetical protein